MIHNLSLKMAVLGALVAVSSASAAQETSFELVDTYGEWILLESRYDTGDFDACWLIREYGDGNTLEMLLSTDISAISFSNETWSFQEDDTYPVDYRFDNGPSVATNIFAVSTGTTVYLDSTLDAILGDLKTSSIFYVVAEFITLAFDLTDSGAAVSGAEDCLARNSSATSANPFEGGADDGGVPNPFAGGGNTTAAVTFEAKTVWEVEPLVTYEDFDFLFEEIRGFDLSVTSQYSDFPLGRYMAEIEESVLAFYWEEDSSTRLTETVYADALTNITSDCVAMADTLAEDVETGGIHVRRGQIGCELMDGELYLRLAVLDLSTLAVVMAFYGDPLEAEFVDAIEDIVIRGFVIALSEE